MIPTIKATVSLCSIFAASITAGTLADGVIGVDTPVSLGSALTCTGVVIGGAWWLSKKFAVQEVMHKSNQKRFRKIEHALNLLCKKEGIQPDLDEEEEE